MRSPWIAAFVMTVGLLGVRTGVGSQAVDRPANPTVALLAELIRLDTSNPPGREGLVADLLAPRFRALGFEMDIVPTPEPGKAHFIARLRGDGIEASGAAGRACRRRRRRAREVDRSTRSPASSATASSFGRGALDFKGGIAVFAQAVMRLAERKVPLARDVIFLVEADEENGRYNTTWLAEDHWAKIDAEFALNEGGWIIKGADGRVKYVSISTADKSSVPAIVTARGTSTHSSMPRPDSAIFALSARHGQTARPTRPTCSSSPLTRRFFETLRQDERAAARRRTSRTSRGNDPARVREADRAISVDPLLHALLRNTIAPVFLNAGFRGNVIPGFSRGDDQPAAASRRRSARRRPRAATASIDDPQVEVRLANPTAAAVEDVALVPGHRAVPRARARSARSSFPAPK